MVNRRHCQIAGKPLELELPRLVERQVQHQGNDLGDGNNVQDWVIRSQVLKPAMAMDAVQRLNGSGSFFERLEIESGPPERVP